MFGSVWGEVMDDPRWTTVATPSGKKDEKIESVLESRAA